MHNKDHKYIYYKDHFGEMIGYLDITQPQDEDSVFITIIAEKLSPNREQWITTNRGTAMAVNLKKVNTWKFYEDYEEFCAEYIEAIL